VVHKAVVVGFALGTPLDTSVGRKLAAKEYNILNKYLTMLLQILFFHPETLQKDERSRSKFRCITVEVWEQGMINSYDVLFGKFFIVFKNTHLSIQLH
jgi:hypothetical protein